MKRIISLGIVFSFLALVTPKGIFAQEVLTGIVQVKKEKSLVPAMKSSASVKASLDLPFIDDFASEGYRLSGPKWFGKSVHVGNDGAWKPWSIGVATLDALNDKLEFHRTSTDSISYGDTLMSAPINLTGASEVFLSFAYQAGGKMDLPELTDSLLVEFYDAANKYWVKVDSIQNKNESKAIEFKQHILKVEDKFLQDGFRFRFRNRISYGANINHPTLEQNCDVWHIDYVRLDKNRSITDLELNDVAINFPGVSLIGENSAVPYKHYEVNAFNTGEFALSFRNNSEKTTWNVTDLYQIKPLYGGGKIKTQIGGAQNVPPTETIVESRNFNYDFTSNTDSAKFEIKMFIKTNAGGGAEMRYNDTLRYYQEFKDYYAYDDGTVEMGYGLQGEGTNNGKVAVVYECRLKDTLSHVDVYFNTIQNAATTRYFKLRVYRTEDEKPKTSVYASKDFIPVDWDSGKSGFQRFKLDSAIIIDGGEEFAIALEQSTENMLNLGFDVNRKPKAKNFYNFDGTWYESDYEGSIMMRAVFATYEGKPSTPAKPKAKSIELKPNPVIQTTYVKGEMDYSNANYKVYDLQGRMVRANKLYSSEINLSDLRGGVYILEITSNNELMGRTKFVKLQ